MSSKRQFASALQLASARFEALDDRPKNALQSVLYIIFDYINAEALGAMAEKTVKNWKGASE